ncbi:MAG: metallophosphoesterase [Deltaproteobacteria bacterium]|nr:metallophosphoesterase [Deltaproteobacteria bacterium]
MRVFAIGDLHLPSLRDKPMDRFGWTGHPGPLAKAWDASVQPDDLVLLVGDLSWATRAPEAAPDFAWIEARPGKKVLVKGNHDHWWGDSYNKLLSFLQPYPSVIGALHEKRAFQHAKLVIAGTRGWTAPEAPSLPQSGEMGAETFRPDLVEREAKRLAASLTMADELIAKTPGAVKLAAMHFPPLYVNAKETVFSKQIEAWKPVACVYGHLHGPGISQGFVGEHGGVPYKLVSCDAAKFAPALILEVA